ncbi:MAG: UV DNA damage repair endonuclease UvsE [Actinomycetota bacterium]|nr:UV DNA damage repair endonuclease UvsE [Actinomycetota bacterium]
MAGMPPYRLGFAVKVLGDGGLKSHDGRRWQNEPSLAVSLALLDTIFDYLDTNDLRVYRMSSSTVPYGTHPDLPQLDYRRQIGAAAERLESTGAKARRYGLRLSTHPGQYTRLNAAGDEVARKAALDVEQDAALLDALGTGPEGVVVVHVGGVYGDRASALERWVRAYERLSARARGRLAVEHDETDFDLAETLWLHERTGVKVVYDHHHHRCNRATAYGSDADAVAAAYRTWPEGVRPKVHVSSPRTELRVVRRRVKGERGVREVLAPPMLDQHADFATPWDVLDVLGAAPGPVDVVVEAKAKDVAVRWLREQLARVDPAAAAAEERGRARAQRTTR